jgi:hypothetical protein
MTALSTGGMIKVIQRGLAGHLTYISATAAWGTNSELALYLPIAAILVGREWDCRCQWPMPRAEQKAGASRTIDFVARRRGKKDWEIAIEVKLLSTRRNGHEVKVAEDLAKLSEFKESNKRANTCLLIVGRKREIDHAYVRMGIEKVFLSAREPVVADLGLTAWGSVAIRL